MSLTWKSFGRLKMNRRQLIEKVRSEMPLYFSRSTMKAFGQRMSDFRFTKVGAVCALVAPSYVDGMLMGYSVSSKMTK